MAYLFEKGLKQELTSYPRKKGHTSSLPLPFLIEFGTFIQANNSLLKGANFPTYSSFQLELELKG